VPGARADASGWIDAQGTLWLFGGNCLDGATASGLCDDLWKFSNNQWTWVAGPNTVNHVGVYGSHGVANAANVPGARQNAVTWIDASGALWLFGGLGWDTASSPVRLGDLWVYRNNAWTWLRGPTTGAVAGTYGTGTADPTNQPGSRYA